jgi:hypothetical protein
MNLSKEHPYRRNTKSVVINEVQQQQKNTQAHTKSTIANSGMHCSTLASYKRKLC